MGAAKKRLVAAMMRKFTAEELLPVLLELRILLQSSRTPWGKALQAALLALLREHKAEVSLAWVEVSESTRFRVMLPSSCTPWEDLVQAALLGLLQVGCGSCCKALASPGKHGCRLACWPCCGSTRLRWGQPVTRHQVVLGSGCSSCCRPVARPVSELMLVSVSCAGSPGLCCKSRRACQHLHLHWDATTGGLKRALSGCLCQVTSH